MGISKRVKRSLKILSALALLLGVWVGINTYPIWRVYLVSPPVRFLEDNHVSVGLYPRGYESASVFTNDDICAIIPVEKIEPLRERLRKLGVKGTFFVIPFHYGRSKLEAGQPQVGMLKALRADGHEIAQHGYQHYCAANKGRNVKLGAELLFLGWGEQRERLVKGRRILSALGFPPKGHRAPGFSGNENTFRVLDEMGFLYGSDIRLPSTTLKTLLFAGFRGNIMYPYHPRSRRLLEVTGQTDPTVRPQKACRIFERFHHHGGVFVFLTHVPQISEPENLDKLEQFINFLQAHNTWLCRLDELCEWWLGREKLEIETKREGDTLLIVYENFGSYSLEDVRVVFKKTEPPPKRYRLEDRSGKTCAEGSIPPSLLILVTLPPA